MKVRVCNGEAQADFNGMILATDTSGTVMMNDKKVRLSYQDSQVIFEWFDKLEHEWLIRGKFQTTSETWVTVEDFV